MRKHETHTYHEIYLITDKEPQFIQYEDWKVGEPETKEWYNLGLYFYLPHARKVLLVGVHNCMQCFTKPQQANIVSWFKHYLSRNEELEDIMIPLYLK